MATVQPLRTLSEWGLEAANRRHRQRLGLTILVAAGFVLILTIYGFPYYRLGLAQRIYSPYHQALKPSGSIGIHLGMLGVLLFSFLFLYPLRKRWSWLGRLGKTKHWLDFHVLIGITAPIVVTFHSSFKLGGLAGVAYWIMMAVALSGFIGRYLYAQIPRSLSAAALSLKEMEGMVSFWADQLERQAIFNKEELAPLFRLPAGEKVHQMSLLHSLLMMLLLDLERPLLVGRLRRRSISFVWTLMTLGGLLPSGNQELESVIAMARRQSWLTTRMLFLTKTQEVFHLWRVIHRPFSYSFVVLVCVHVAVVLMLGYY